jgi:hypothetical protein
MFKNMEKSPLFLIAGIGIFGYGAVNFFNLVIVPHVLHHGGKMMSRMPWAKNVDDIRDVRE